MTDSDSEVDDDEGLVFRSRRHRTVIEQWPSASAAERNTLRAGNEAMLLEGLGRDEARALWFEMSDDQRRSVLSAIVWPRRIWLLKSMPENDRNAMWEGLSEVQRRANTPTLESDFFDLLSILSPQNIRILWESQSAGEQQYMWQNAGAELFMALSTAIDIHSLWEEVPGIGRSVVWRGLAPEVRGLLFTNFSDDYQINWFQQLPPSERSLLSEHISPDRYVSVSTAVALAEKAAARLSLRQSIESLFPREWSSSEVEEVREQLRITIDEISDRFEATKRTVDNVSPGDDDNADREAQLQQMTAAQLTHKQLKDFAFVCERVDAALNRQPDPATSRMFHIPNPEDVRGKMVKIITAFAKRDNDPREAILYQCEQGTGNCVDNLMQAVSAMHFICTTHEAKQYKGTYELLNNIVIAFARDTIQKIAALANAGRQSNVESVEVNLAVETVLGREFNIPDTQKDMAYAYVGGTQEEFEQWKAIANALCANGGAGDREEAKRLIAPLLQKANETLRQKFDVRKAAGEIPEGQEFVPMPNLLRSLVDYVSHDDTWKNIWRDYLRAAYAAKFNETTNSELNAALQDAYKRVEPVLDAQEKIDADSKIRLDVPGIEEQVTSANIAQYLDKAMKAYKGNEENIRESVYSDLTRKCVEAYVHTRVALGAHQGETWQMLLAGHSESDQAMHWDKVSPAVQLELEMVRHQRPEVREIEIGRACNDADKASIWIAAQLLDFTVNGMDNTSPVLSSIHHEILADSLSEKLKEIPREDAQERGRLQQRIDEQKQVGNHKRLIERRLDTVRENLRKELDSVIGMMEEIKLPFPPVESTRRLAGEGDSLRETLRAHWTALNKMQEQIQQRQPQLSMQVLEEAEEYLAAQRNEAFPAKVEQMRATLQRYINYDLQNEHDRVSNQLGELNYLIEVMPQERENIDALKASFLTYLEEIDSELKKGKTPQPISVLRNMEAPLAQYQKDRKEWTQRQISLKKLKASNEKGAKATLGDARQIPDLDDDLVKLLPDEALTHLLDIIKESGKLIDLKRPGLSDGLGGAKVIAQAGTGPDAVALVKLVARGNKYRVLTGPVAENLKVSETLAANFSLNSRMGPSQPSSSVAMSPPRRSTAR